MALAARLADGRAQPGAGAPRRIRRRRPGPDQPDGAVPQARPGGAQGGARRGRPAARRPARRPLSLIPPRKERAGRFAHHLRLEDGVVVGRTETILAADAGAWQSRDPMTGVRDARAARAWITQQLGAGAGEPALVILLLAVSRFDTINAAFGRATGDDVLQAAARRMERLVDADGRRRLVARLAGAEFAVLLAAPTSLDEGRFLAGQLVEAIGRPFMSGDHVIALGSRAGVAASDSRRRRGRSAPPRQRRARRGQGVRDRGGPGGRGRSGRRQRARRPARDRPAPSARPGRDRDSVPAAGLGRRAGGSSGSRRSRAGATPNSASSAPSPCSTSPSAPIISSSSPTTSSARRSPPPPAWPEALSGLRLAVNITAADIVRPGFAAQFIALVAGERLRSRPAHRRGHRERADRGSRRGRPSCSPGCARAGFGWRSTISAPAIRASPI